MRHMLSATDGLPLNFGFTGKGNDAGEIPLEEIVKAGACGLKLHEDWGSTPATIVSALNVGDKYDVQVCNAVLSLNHVAHNSTPPQQVNIHTDTLNESGFVESQTVA